MDRQQMVISFLTKIIKDQRLSLLHNPSQGNKTIDPLISNAMDTAVELADILIEKLAEANHRETLLPEPKNMTLKEAIDAHKSGYLTNKGLTLVYCRLNPDLKRCKYSFQIYALAAELSLDPYEFADIVKEIQEKGIA